MQITDTRIEKESLEKINKKNVLKNKGNNYLLDMSIRNGLPMGSLNNEIIEVLHMFHNLTSLELENFYIEIFSNISFRGLL